MTCFADLPSEIVDYTLDYLWSDAAALRSSGLVCKRFGPASRRHLFACVDLKRDVSIKRFDAVLQRNPLLSQYVEAVIVRDALSDLQIIVNRLYHLRPSYLHIAGLLPADVRWLTQSASLGSLFSGVQALSLHHCRFYTTFDFRRLLALGPSITRLSVKYMRLGHGVTRPGREDSSKIPIPPIGTISFRKSLEDVAYPILLSQSSSVHTITLQTGYKSSDHPAFIFDSARRRGPFIRKLRIQPATVGGMSDDGWKFRDMSMDIHHLRYDCFTALTHLCLDGAIIKESDERLSRRHQTRIIQVLTASAAMEVVTIIASVTPQLHPNHCWAKFAQALENIPSRLRRFNVVIDESYCQRVQGQAHPLQAVVERDLAHLKDRGVLHIYDTLKDPTVLWTLRDSIYSAEHNGPLLASSVSYTG